MWKGYQLLRDQTGQNTSLCTRRVLYHRVKVLDDENVFI